jgi:hypothetical protein
LRTDPVSENMTKLTQGKQPDVPASFAEGALVRSTNAVYKPYGVGRVVKVRDDLAKVEFNPSVFMSPRGRMERDHANDRENPSCRFLS